MSTDLEVSGFSPAVASQGAVLGPACPAPPLRPADYPKTPSKTRNRPMPPPYRADLMGWGRCPVIEGLEAKAEDLHRTTIDASRASVPMSTSVPDGPLLDPIRRVGIEGVHPLEGLGEDLLDRLTVERVLVVQADPISQLAVDDGVQEVVGRHR